MVRRLLADHELPNKVAAGKLEDIRPCTGCLHCMDVRNRNQPIECRVNPDLGKEREYAIKPALKKKKVMVVGGGLSGMEAALVAAQRGHEVTLYEKSSKLGGLVPIAALVKDLETDVLMELIHYFKYQIDQRRRHHKDEERGYSGAGRGDEAGCRHPGLRRNGCNFRKYPA